MVFVFDWLETVSYVVHLVAVGVSQAGEAYPVTVSWVANLP